MRIETLHVELLFTLHLPITRLYLFLLNPTNPLQSEKKAIDFFRWRISYGETSYDENETQVSNATVKNVELDKIC